MLRSNNYKYTSLVSNILIPIFIVSTIVSLMSKTISEYVFIFRLICFSISFLIFIMSRIKITEKDLGIFNYIGSGYIYISILGFIGLGIFNISSNTLVAIIFQHVIDYLCMINILISILFFNKGYSRKIQNVIFIVIIPMLFIIIRNQYFSLFTINDIYNIRKQASINQVILFLLFILIVYIYKRINMGRSYKWVIYAGFFLVLGNLFVWLSFILKNNIIIYISGVKCFSYFIVYDKIEEALLVNTIEHAYEGLIKAKGIKTRLNKNLKSREKELRELNLLLEKSEKRYYDVVNTLSDGLMIFENDIMIHFNYYEKNYYNKINNSKYIHDFNELKLDNVIKKLTGDEFSSSRDINDFKTKILISDEFEENRTLEISLTEVYDNKKILIFNDITQLVKQKEEILELEKGIINENIKDEFYSNISHELKTPINVIYSALQLNDVYLENGLLDKVASNRGVVKQNCLRLVRTINNFIDSNKLVEGCLDIDKKLYNIVDILENVVLSCEYYMKLKETMLVFDPHDEEIYLYCDKSYMERIMLNILSNSLKYGKHGGNIHVSLKKKGNDRIIIEVINDAESIPEDKRAMIFDKFTKVDESLNRPSEGSGLGLYLTRELIKLHNGEITLSTGEVYGNTFKIIFPCNNIKHNIVLLDNNLEINELKEKIDIEFSDIYF